MCTVTYIPLQNKVLLTSNRDEKGTREKALQPGITSYGNKKLLFPKDAQAGGTWIAASDAGSIMVLLNGGFIKHEPAAQYRKSRGLIFLDILTEEKAIPAFKKIHLLGIEPFTLVIWEDDKLFECRWSGEEKYIREMDATKPHIWSSVTLYTSDIIHKREQWFNEWLTKYPQPTVSDILSFHLFGGEGDKENDIRMNRNNTMFTVSVTSVECNRNKAVMHYEDLVSRQKTEASIAFVQEQPVA